jgi:polar amino acid transport system permease protein/polar amino acid transport system substrate-binding protein
MTEATGDPRPSRPLATLAGSAAAILVAVALVLIVAFQEQLGIEHAILQTLRTNFINNFLVESRYLWLINGLGQTLVITIFSSVIGIVIGLFLAIVRVLSYTGKRIFLLSRFVDIYLTVIRGTPVVVQLLIIYFIIFGSVQINKTLVASLAFGINSGAYVAEIIRSGIMAVDRGQMEAGRSLGLGYAKTMQKIILPQAFKNILPALFNELITLLKETAVAGYIAIADLTRAGYMIRSRTYDAFMPLLVIAAIYLVIVQILTRIMARVERRMRRSDHR